MFKLLIINTHHLGENPAISSVVVSYDYKIQADDAFNIIATSSGSRLYTISVVKLY